MTLFPCAASLPHVVTYLAALPLQVSVAVLLDNFVNASAEMEHEKEVEWNLARKAACTVSPIYDSRMMPTINIMSTDYSE